MAAKHRLSLPFQCLSCGEGKHIVNFRCKGKACPQCGKRYSRESMEKE